jgi:hypothetical protein
MTHAETTDFLIAACAVFFALAGLGLWRAWATRKRRDK